MTEFAPSVAQPHAHEPGAAAPGPATSLLAKHDPGARQMPPQRALVLLRYTLIIATAYLLLVEEGLHLPPFSSMLLVVLALASNVVIALLPARIVNSPYFSSAIIAIDTAWITAALVLSGRFSAEFFLVYFFILLLATIGESLWLITLAAVAVCCGYLYVLAAMGGTWSLWTSPYFSSAIIAIDTVWITAALVLSGRFSAEFFLVYFFILLLATIGESLWLITLAAVAVCCGYLYVLAAMGGTWSLWTSPSLIRLPFLFATAAFYGYLVERTRVERRRAQEADRIKSEFLGTISHELRTPLSVILGYVDLLLENEFGTVPPEQRTVLGKVQAAGENLHRYLSRLLDVSRLVNRLQSGREVVVCSEFALADVFSELRYDFPDLDVARIKWPATADFPRLDTDREKLVTIMRNLVENAVKYGNGTPTLVGAQRDAAADTIVLTVSDEGIGITAPDLPHVFDPFRRTAPAVATNAQGVGLGLYIVKQFIELLDGTVEVESAPGVGSTFTVCIPRVLRRGRARGPGAPNSAAA